MSENTSRTLTKHILWPETPAWLQVLAASAAEETCECLRSSVRENNIEGAGGVGRRGEVGGRCRGRGEEVAVKIMIMLAGQEKEGGGSGEGGEEEEGSVIGSGREGAPILDFADAGGGREGEWEWREGGGGQTVGRKGGDGGGGTGRARSA